MKKEVETRHERVERMEKGRPTAAWIRDLEMRVEALEALPSIRRDNIRQASFDNERRHYDDLQARVDKFVEWARQEWHLERNANGDGRSQPALFLDDVLAKFRELGLMDNEDDR